MELEEAKRIVKILADGINPTTGASFPKDSPYNEPHVIRALFRIIESKKSGEYQKKTDEERQQENIANGRPKNAGLPWSDQSRSEVSSKFQAGKTIDELAEYFERTRAAIVSELKRQGHIDPGS
jgi:hypothetical protein